uniref:RING-type E3 ubiquitin transferase n=1 Tax=Leersia perrieri TaxID=77586 RepID=A0A0D9VG32_9ORYZ
MNPAHVFSGRRSSRAAPRSPPRAAETEEKAEDKEAVPHTEHYSRGEHGEVYPRPLVPGLRNRHRLEEQEERQLRRNHSDERRDGAIDPPPSPPPRFYRSAPTSPPTTSPIHYPLPLPPPQPSSSSSAPKADVAGELHKGKAPERTAVEEGPTKSDYTAMMRTALATLKDDAAADDEEEAAAAAVMEQAMTGLMDLAYKKREPPELPYEFATRWPIPILDDGTLQARTMRDPVILASGYSVDEIYQNHHKQNSPQTNIYTVTDPHSLFVPNHLLQDMISAWCLDHSDLSPCTTSDKPSIPLEQQIQGVLEKFSGDSASQREALNLIQLLSKTTNGVQPCLAKHPDLITVLINLKKKYKSSWTRALEEDRLSIILNLTMHRQNRKILAEQSELPGALKKIAKKAGNLGERASSLAKVASIVAVLSESGMFRKRMLDARGMKMLRDMLKIKKDTVVTTKAATAILALCADDEGKKSAKHYDVPETLLECHMFTDEILLLLERQPKAKKICDQALKLVNIVMAEHESGAVTSKGIHSAISLIHGIVERDVGKMRVVKNMEDFKERLHQLSSDRMPMETIFKVEEITSILSDAFPAPKL